MSDLCTVCHIKSASFVTNTPFTQNKNYLDRDPDYNLDCDLDHHPDYTGHSLFNTTKHITLLFIVQSLLHHNPPNIWIKMIQITIQIECLHGTKFLDPDCNLHRHLDNFAQC